MEFEIATRLACSHTYHAECIEAWAARAANCPFCRAAIVTSANDLPVMVQQRWLLAPEINELNRQDQHVAELVVAGAWIRNPAFEARSSDVEHVESS